MRSNRLSTLAFALVATTWGLLVFGASVRVHGAGLACPDWPLCFGQVVPAIDFGVAFEFGHRVVAGVVSLWFLALGGLMWRRGVSGSLQAMWGFGLFVLGVQIVLGGLTVLELLAEWTVTSHLLAGNTFCLSVLLVALGLRAEEDGWPALEPVSLVQRVAAAGMAMLLPVQLALGGLVSSSYAGLVCPSWPSCAGGVWFPTFEGLVGLQLSHRLVGYALAGVALAAFTTSVGHRRLRAPTALILALVLVQIGLGVANVLTRLPVEVTLAHTGVAAWLVLATTWLNWRAFRAPLSHPALQPAEAR
ncbi:MAG: heme A synthase [Alphaproteobacteria bacterium]|nr:heme A synthase [Alphaproteobacteria bacterium]